MICIKSWRVWIIGGVLAVGIMVPLMFVRFKSKPDESASHEATASDRNSRGPVFNGRPLTTWAVDAAGYDAGTAGRARQVLRANGTAARAGLAEILRDDSSTDEMRIQAAGTLGWISEASDPEISSLFKAFQSPKRVIRETALEALRRIRIPSARAIPLLLATTDNPMENKDARHMATQYLGDYLRSDPEALAALERLANDPDPTVQALARSSLDRRGPAALVFTDDRMTAALKNYGDGDPQVRRSAVDWVKENGAASVPELLAFLENPQLGGRERALAAQALGNAGKNGEAEVSALLRAVKDREPSVREYAALALASLDHVHSFTVPLFIGLLSDQNARIRRRAAEHLDSISGFAKPAIPELVNLIEREKDPQVLNAAKAALKHIQAKAGS